MKGTKRVLGGFCAVMICALAVLFASAPVFADCAGVDTVVVDCSAGSSNNGLWALLLIALTILAAGVGVVAVGGIVYAAFLYTSAADDQAQVAKAKDMIRNTIIGLVSFAGMYSFLGYIIPGGFLSASAPSVSSSRPGGSNQSGPSGNSDEPQQQSSGPKPDLVITFAYQNLGRTGDITAAAEKAIMQKMRFTLGSRDNVIYNFGEIDDDPKGEHALLQRTLGSRDWTHFDSDTPTAVRVNDNWKISGQDRIHLYDGGVQCQTGPANLIITKVSSVKNKRARIAVISTHWINHAYDDRPAVCHNANGQLSTIADRRAVWDAAWKVFDKTATALHDDDYDVVLAGDLNRQGSYKGKYPAIAAGKLTVLNYHGPDIILGISAKKRKITQIKPGFIAPPQQGEQYHGTVFAKMTFTGG